MSRIQRKIFKRRLNKKCYTDNKDEFHMERNDSITAELRHTIAENVWTTTCNGGEPPYLSEVELLDFYGEINQRAKGLACEKVIEAYQIAYELLEYRYSRALYLAGLVHPDEFPTRGKRIVCFARSISPLKIMVKQSLL